MAGTYDPITSLTLSSAVSSYTFNNIPQTYTDLVLVAIAQRGLSNSGGAGTLTLNGDTGSNYSSTILYGDSGAAYSYRWSNQTVMYGAFAAGDSENNINVISFLNYSNATTYKTVLSRMGWVNTNGRVTAGVNLWRSTAAITSITLSAANNIASGSTFALYGVKAA